MQAFVPKTRKPKYELSLKIIYLNNVPLVTGACYVKWHIAGSATAEHRGKTHRAPIKDHLVTWDFETVVGVRFTADKSNQLQDLEICFEVVQEYATGAKGERITLGTVRLNLAEYVNASLDTPEGVTRRYLMQDSKINSTIKIGIALNQVEGEHHFFGPSLKSAPIFGGIAGVINLEQHDGDDSGATSSMNTKVSRDLNELQDMYRKTLTAQWSTAQRELPADQCIEDIFAGGTGFGKGEDASQGRSLYPDDDSDSDATASGPRGPSRPTSRDDSSKKGSVRSSQDTHGQRTSRQTPETGKGRLGRPEAGSSSDDRAHRPKRVQDIAETDVLDDMRSWRVSS